MSKKAALILFISIVCCLSAQAQKDTLVYYIKTFHASETMKVEQQVFIKDSADFVRVILPPDTSTDKKLFIVNDFYKNGKSKMTGKSTNQEYQPYLTGACMEFFPNGRRRSVKNYENGKATGDISKYFPNGRLYLTGSYNNDGKLIINECRDSTGKVLVENGNGHCIEYDGDFKHVYIEGNLVNGLEEGEWRGFLEDSARFECVYEKGVVKRGMSYDKKGNTYPFTTTAFTEPEFKNGEREFANFLGRNLHYPNMAKENKVQGKVFISFMVNKNGQLSDIKIVRALGAGCDEEVIRVMKACPPWVPARQFGIPIPMPYVIPISFTLSYEYIK